MLQFIKKILPEPLKKFLIAIKSKTIDSYQKKKFAKRMQIKHQELLRDLKGKEKIRVIFLVIHANTWKADEVFKRMLEDSFFEPIILVVPYITYNCVSAISIDRTIEVNAKSYNYFKARGYETYSAIDEEGNIVRQISDLNPDMVYFSCPYPETNKEFYSEVYENYLCFYIPYFYMIYSWDGDDKFYNTNFHNSMMRTYLPHRASYDKALDVSQADMRQWFLSGYPSCEKLYSQASEKQAWSSNSDNKIKLIWAPHHSIYEDMLPNLGSFLFVADFLKEIAIKYKDKLYISFKPHPLLKAKLDDHIDWGVDKTNEYYSFWEQSGFSQLDEGEYIDLFIQSDAMLHDSSSFLAEYLFVEKPVMYIDFKNKFDGQFNSFGMKAYRSCLIAKSTVDIELFVEDLLCGANQITKNHTAFLESEIYPFYKDKLPSERIIEDIKKSLGALSVH